MSDGGHLRLTLADAAQSALYALSQATSPDDDVIDGFLGDLYRPRPTLRSYLQEFRAYDPVRATARERVEGGYLLEKIAYLAFKGLSTPTSVKSFRAASAQYDLLVSGDSLQWQYLQWLVRMPTHRRTVLVECKATKGPADHPQFARVCSLVEHDLAGAPGMAVFFTISGATGFPTAGRKRLGHLSEARLLQALFYARTCVPIVVLDREEILTLDQPGSLLRLLCRKSLDVALQSGRTPPVSAVKIDEDLPRHLSGIDV